MNKPDTQYHNQLEHLLNELFNETISTEQHKQLEQILLNDKQARNQYLQNVELHRGLERNFHSKSSSSGNGLPLPFPAAKQDTVVSARTQKSRATSLMRTAAWLCTAVVLGALLYPLLTHVPPQLPIRSRVAEPNPKANSNVIVKQMAGVQFTVDSPRLREGNTIASRVEYAILEGMLEMQFQTGATALLEGPVVFLVNDQQRMQLQYGHCSVHAPAGAEGFVVETPLTQVIDRGTRFSVEVDETGQADVQVLEGLAEVRPTVRAQNFPTTTLKGGSARRYALDGQLTMSEIPYDSNHYTRSLPDRVITYSATHSATGDGVTALKSVTLQRDGQRIEYQADQCIGIKVLHFKGANSRTNMTTPQADGDPLQDSDPKTRRTDLLENDLLLTTGLINPGGNTAPLQRDPVINPEEDNDNPNTPGLAIQFDAPIRNEPGPDIVLFDLHVAVHPEQGDPFHVSPLKFRPGLKSATIHKYDIRLSSPEALKLAPFYLYRFQNELNSLNELQTSDHNKGTRHLLPVKVLATGIDLSSLGYQPGEYVTALFIQDAHDDENYIDPVMILGLPPMKSDATQSE